MRRRFLAAFLVVGGCASTPVGQADGGGVAGLAGRWRMRTFEGRPVDSGDRTEWAFAGRHVAIETNMQRCAGEFAVDPSVTPMHMDVTCGGEHMHAIFALDGERLIIKIGGDAGYPGDFRVADGYDVHAFERTHGPDEPDGNAR